MRVIAGVCRSMPLKTPKGLDTRPTTDRIKETLFNMLQMDVPDSVFVDLFSGSGGIGIEALSRGAKHAYFADTDKEALSCIKDNLNFTKMSDKATVISRDARDAVLQIHDKADIIFMDPPYALEIEYSIMQVLKNAPCVTTDTLFIIEAEKDKDFTDIESLGYEIVKEKIYKTNKHVFFRLTE